MIEKKLVKWNYKLKNEKLNKKHNERKLFAKNSIIAYSLLTLLKLVFTIIFDFHSTIKSISFPVGCYQMLSTQNENCCQHYQNK